MILLLNRELISDGVTPLVDFGSCSTCPKPARDTLRSGKTGAMLCRRRRQGKWVLPEVDL